MSEIVSTPEFIEAVGKACNDMGDNFSDADGHYLSCPICGHNYSLFWCGNKNAQSSIEHLANLITANIAIKDIKEL